MSKSTESISQSQRSKTMSELQGKISTKTFINVDLDDGLSVTAPEELIFKPGSIGTIKDIIDIVCRFIDCGGGNGGGGGDGCTTITIENPDGSTTTIKQCPPKKTIA